MAFSEEDKALIKIVDRKRIVAYDVDHRVSSEKLEESWLRQTAEEANSWTRNVSTFV